MGYCMNCGKQLPDDAIFCNYCGAKYDGSKFISSVNNGQETVSKASVSKPERQKSLEESVKLKEYFGKKQSLYDEYDALLSNLPRQISDARNGSKGAVFWGIVLMVIGFGLFMGGIGSLFQATAGYVFLGVLLFIIAIVVLILGMRLVTTIYFRSIDRSKKKLNDTQNRIGQITEELSKYYDQYGYCPIGIEYTNPKVFTQIYDVIRQGRADTPKEAINVLRTESRWNAMEKYAAQSAAANRTTAVNSGITAAFMVGSFFR